MHSPTSTSFMTGTGLKKCSPPNLSFLCTALAISVMDRDEVLDANRVELQQRKTLMSRMMMMMMMMIMMAVMIRDIFRIFACGERETYNVHI